MTLVVAIGTGVAGRDFGHHWDEAFQRALAAHSVRTGVLLPGNYNYPSASYWLTLAPVLPALLTSPGPLSAERAEQLAQLVEHDHHYLLRVRTLLISLSALGAAWVFLLLRKWGRSQFEAFLGATLIGWSWEYAYHSRWLAPDALMAQFGALAGCCLIASLRDPTQSRLWMYGAAAAAGLATSTKYPAGLLMVPVVASVFLDPSRPRGAGPLVRRTVGLLAMFAGVYLIVTPGTVLDPGRFRACLDAMRLQYATGHFGYTTTGVFDQLTKILVYLGVDFFAPYRACAVLVTNLCILGTYVAYRTSWREACLLAAFPVTYFLFMASQHVLIVRNLLVLGPFLAAFAARGAGFLLEQQRRPALRWGLAATLAGIVIANALWLWTAARSIQNVAPGTHLVLLAEYLERSPRGKVFASAGVRTDLTQAGIALSMLSSGPEAASELAFYPEELAPWQIRPTNISHLATRWFGPYEVNWNYYTTWSGAPRIVLVDRAKGLESGVQLP